MVGRRVLVVGGGGREHALALRLAESASVGHVAVAPGNGGTVAPLVPVPIAADRVDDLTSFAVRERYDLVVVGPEAPLVAGLSDALAARGVPTFGPSAAAARLEGSKAYMKGVAERAGIATAAFGVFTDADEAARWIRSRPAPPVVKADGLCAGKGVVVAGDHAEAEAAARSMLVDGAFGAAGRTIVIEDRLEGAEASVHAICDGERFVVLPPVQDHKRIFEGDRGPNTGGMGAYGPAPLVGKALEARVAREVFEPALRQMAAEGAPFRGALFAGLMIAPDGEPALLEFNVRFGDPETEVLTALLDGDFGDVLAAAAEGRLDPAALVRSDRHAVAVVLAAHGYPGTVRSGDAISGLDAAARIEGARVLHAGTRRDGERLVTAGGRVLVVSATAATLRAARDRAYEAAACIRFDGMQLRRDIGHRALVG